MLSPRIDYKVDITASNVVNEKVMHGRMNQSNGAVSSIWDNSD